MYKLLTSMLFVCVCISFSVFALDAQEIIRRVDAKETFETAYAEGSISTTDRFGVKTTTFRSWARGAHDSLLEFTSVAERGQKVLRLQGELYLFYPDAEELIRLQGAALRQSMLGSDISYEDMTGEKNTLSQYTVTLLGTESLHTRVCYVLELNAKTRTVAYPKQKLWVDTETYVVWRAEYATQANRLLKEMSVSETMVIDGREIASVTLIKDAMRRNSQTLLTITHMEVNIPIDPRLFTLQHLTW